MFRPERIKELREAFPLTQTQLAALVGSTQATVSRIEGGEGNTRPDRSLAVRLAKALRVDLSDVFEDPESSAEEGRQSGESPTSVTATTIETALLRAVVPQHHVIADLVAAVEAVAEAAKLTRSTPDFDAIARVWLDAARDVRLSGARPTPATVMARVALVKKTA